MALSTEEIKANLTEFAVRWKARQGYEKGEAQQFQLEFFACFGEEIVEQVKFESHTSGVGFVDGMIEDLVIVEMKSAAEAAKLEKHRKQVLDYWRGLSDAKTGKQAPPYVILCAFTSFEIWQPGLFPDEPVLTLDLDELPAHFDAFAFLLGRSPIFNANLEKVSVDAANELASLFDSLESRGEGLSRERRSFLLQCVWCMFAEDTGQIDQLGFTRILDGLIRDPERASEDEIGGLFERLNDPSPNRPAHGLYKGVPYVNGPLFAEPARLHLVPEELLLLRRMCDFDWSRISPAVFGSLMQGVFGPERQHRLGAHYTPEAEIQLVVEPTIIRPWRFRIGELASFDEAIQAFEDLHDFRILDPACGCGNFLSIAYRELRRLESILIDRIKELSILEGRGEWTPGPDRYSLSNVQGIEIESFAVELARLSLWMAQWLSGEELGLHERTLPLADLDNVRRGDALVLEWPTADAIIGNPPYHGSQNLQSVLAEEQIEFLKSQFGVGLKDLCVYWFRKAADRMGPGDRAGLVGTNSVSQNRARGASLNYVVEQGGVITNAVSRHKWPGEAVVNVSIVNWVMKPEFPPARFVLDGEQVAGINTRLQESVVPVEEYEALNENRGRSFQGPIPGGDFYLDEPEAVALLTEDGSSAKSVIRRYLVGKDIAEAPDQSPQRWIIDFSSMELQDAMKFPACLSRVRSRVKPEREKNNREAYRKYWWRFVEPRPGMRAALKRHERFVAGTATGKRFLFTWVDGEVCPSNATNVFAFEDDYAMGILNSSFHGVWALSEGSTLEDRPRYTPTSCFETFPWPDRDKDHLATIGNLSVELLELRSRICQEQQIGLTKLYNQVDEGAWQDLVTAHRNLDEAVAKAYGWPVKVAHDPLEIKKRLAERHGDIIEGRIEYQPFG